MSSLQWRQMPAGLGDGELELFMARPAMRLLFVVVALGSAALSATTATAQVATATNAALKPWNATRTPWGDPDLQGYSRTRRNGTFRWSDRTGLSEIFRGQACSFCDASKHPRPDFLAVVEGEDEVRPAVAGESAVRTCLSLKSPAEAGQGSQHATGLNGRPLAHAA